MIKCEKCGEELASVLVDFFNYDGSDRDVEVPIVAYGEAVIMELNANWTGYELTEEEKLDTITCPHCKKFPFNHREVQHYDFTRVVLFRDSCQLNWEIAERLKEELSKVIIRRGIHDEERANLDSDDVWNVIDKVLGGTE